MVKSDHKNIPFNDVTLSFLFWSFVKIGATSFGGFMALVSVVQKELVKKKPVIEDHLLLDAISIASVLPGPMAFNVIAYIGYTLRGLKGALISMLAILLPSFIFMIILSYLYLEYGQLTLLNNFFKGVLPAVSAIIVAVAFNMSKKHIKDYKQVLISLLAIAAILSVKSVFIPVIIIASSGVVGVLIYKHTLKPEPIIIPLKVEYKHAFKYFILVLIIISLCIGVVLPSVTTGDVYDSVIITKELMITFSSISVTLFGGGYVIIPAMQEIIVDGLQWLSNKEFVDAIALGQLTPGPIFISATFIGYKVGGFIGAITATLAVFIPPACIMILFSEFINKIKNTPIVKAAFKGLRPAVIGMILAAAYTISKSYPVNYFSVIIFLIVLVASINYKIDVIYLIPISGISGILFYNFFLEI
ncbi:chromate efflux transporter [Formosa sediminum]|uniref:Chromate efflux transporter n=1 Tax=Formosa sediminum TaxID=2594004 RepID=A0A516GUI3_9FLAO|nr:chromate efflux transporter [Formosa sediminum]QDO95177.1 chromate efflux transporter [Formosa sediminum]